ncbi:hypothetical protein ACRRTK_023368 [Alexandromys fortis]
MKKLTHNTSWFIICSKQPSSSVDLTTWLSFVFVACFETVSSSCSSVPKWDYRLTALPSDSMKTPIEESRLLSVLGVSGLTEEVGMPVWHCILLAAYLRMPFVLNPRSYNFPLAKLSTVEAPLCTPHSPSF